ncbi:Protein of unknown function [Cotesia congregata]|uniref:Uncharacterized protein n=1 Tax=Cotesia congregata TaxID=51543 RepID=A0A8J2MMH1_COTCN|nr:Protein of unknown function [Cotesia congregata]
MGSWSTAGGRCCNRLLLAPLVKTNCNCKNGAMTGHEPAKRDQRGLSTWIICKIIDDGRMAASRTSWNDGLIGTRSERSTHA